MKRRILATIMATLMLISTSMVTLAAPKQMPDGGTFDPEFYAATYPDVAAALGTDEAALYAHYTSCGINENRRPYAESAEVQKNTENTSASVAWIQYSDGSRENVPAQEDALYLLGVYARSIELLKTADEAETNMIFDNIVAMGEEAYDLFCGLLFEVMNGGAIHVDGKTYTW